MKLTPRTIRVIAAAAGIHCHGRWLRTTGLVASVMRFPQLASGGLTPRPRKLRLDSSSTAVATPNVATTVSGPKMFGRVCRNRITRSAVKRTSISLAAAASARAATGPSRTPSVRPIVRCAANGRACASIASSSGLPVEPGSGCSSSCCSSGA